MGEQDTVSRSGWGSGPWDDEPDRVAFEHVGLPCLLLRSEVSGAWCGYAAVPPGHPAHGKAYDDLDVRVHGGLTYANACQEGGLICHVPKPGKSADVWWLGFDCAHAWDFSPALAALARRLACPMPDAEGRSYKSVSFARAETERLAEQLAGMNEGHS